MANIFIGFEIRKGSFTSKSGELVNYNKRILRFITDEGADNTHIGFDSFSADLQLEAIASCFGVPANDSAVDDALTRTIQKEVTLRYAPRNGENKLVFFAPVKS